MNITDEIITALLLLGPDDLEAARKYLRWIKVRRQVHNRFYFVAHWVSSERKYHWVGS